MGKLKIGWARVEVSIDEPVQINGQLYMRVSEGIHDPLYVTALCVDGGEGNDVAIFVSCDVTSLNRGVIPGAEAIVEKMRPEIPKHALVMNATHTHTSPALFETEPETPDGKPIYPGIKYRQFLTEKCAEAAIAAWDNRKPGGMGYGYGYAVVSHSRRTVYFEDQGSFDPLAGSPNGHCIMYGKTNKPEFSHYEAGADHFVNVMFTVDADRKLTGMIVNVPCPSQVGEQLTVLSADYWCEVRQLVAAEFGEDVYVLPQCAAAGDLAPRILHYKQAQARRIGLKYDLKYVLKDVKRNNDQYYKKIIGERRDIAQRIVSGIRDVHSWAMKDLYFDVPVRHTFETVALTKPVITEADCDEARAKLEQINEIDAKARQEGGEELNYWVSRCKSARNRNQQLLDRYEEQKTEPKMDTNIHVVQIGDIAFATNRFELYMDYMHRIQARSPFVQTFVVQLAGDEGGSYLATERGMTNKGYGANQYAKVGPIGGQELVENTLRILNDMKNQS